MTHPGRRAAEWRTGGARLRAQAGRTPKGAQTCTGRPKLGTDPGLAPARAAGQYCEGAHLRGVHNSEK